MSNSTRPQSVEEIEQDLRIFLSTIEPILQIVEANKNRSALYTAGITLKKVLSNTDFLKNLGQLQPLLEKYAYLLNE